MVIGALAAVTLKVEGWLQLRRMQLWEQLKTSTGPLIPQASVFKGAEKMKGGGTWG